MAKGRISSLVVGGKYKDDFNRTFQVLALEGDKAQIRWGDGARETLELAGLVESVVFQLDDDLVMFKD